MILSIIISSKMRRFSEEKIQQTNLANEQRTVLGNMQIFTYFMYEFAACYTFMGIRAKSNEMSNNQGTVWSHLHI